MSLIEAHYTATAWPLLLLVRGLRFESAFDQDCRIRPHARRHLGLLSRLRSPTHLRFCLACVEEQRRNFGTSWWKCSSNLPLVVACPVHEIGLWYASLSAILAGNGALPHDVADARPLNAAGTDAPSLAVAALVTRLHHRAATIDSIEVAMYIDAERRAMAAGGVTDISALLGTAQLLTHERYGGRVGVTAGALTSDGDDDLRLLLLVAGLLRSNRRPERQFRNCITTPCRTWPEAAITLEDAFAGVGFAAVRERYGRMLLYCRQIVRNRRSPALAPAIAVLGARDIHMVQSLFVNDALPSFTQSITDEDAALGLLALAAASRFLHPSARARRRRQYAFALQSRPALSIERRNFAEQCFRASNLFLRGLKAALEAPGAW